MSVENYALAQSCVSPKNYRSKSIKTPHNVTRIDIDKYRWSLDM